MFQFDSFPEQSKFKVINQRYAFDILVAPYQNRKSPQALMNLPKTDSGRDSKINL